MEQLNPAGKCPAYFIDPIIDAYRRSLNITDQNVVVRPQPISSGVWQLNVVCNTVGLSTPLRIIHNSRANRYPEY